jgi:hypothetical protein
MISCETLTIVPDKKGDETLPNANFIFLELDSLSIHCIECLSIFEPIIYRAFTHF